MTRDETQSKPSGGALCGDGCVYFDPKYRYVLGHWNLYVGPSLRMERRRGESIKRFVRRARKEYPYVMVYRTWWRKVATVELG